MCITSASWKVNITAVWTLRQFQHTSILAGNKLQFVRCMWYIRYTVSLGTYSRWRHYTNIFLSLLSYWRQLDLNQKFIECGSRLVWVTGSSARPGNSCYYRSYLVHFTSTNLIKSRIKWAGHVTRMGELRNEYKNVVGKR